MPAPDDVVTRALVRMLQDGTFQRLVGCAEGQRATVAFHVERIYTVRLRRTTIVVSEQERERILRYAQHRWRPVRSSRFPRRRIVLDRRQGTLLQSTALGTLQPGPRKARRVPVLVA